jgi:sugar/nucleoside kinase (ribokinase family)
MIAVRGAPSPDVVFVGEINLDLILYGLPEELHPDRELLASEMCFTLGSSSAICAHNLAVLGTRVGFLSLVGEDAIGAISLERMEAAGVEVSRIRRAPAPAATGLTVILPNAHGRFILTYPGTMFDLRISDLDHDYLRMARHFHLASFFLHRALRPDLAELFRATRAAGLTTSLDTNDDPEDRWGRDLLEVLRHVDVFLPNEREAKKIAGKEDLREAIDFLAGIVPVVVVKRGAQGAIARRGRQQFSSPAVAVEPVDLVGAGDSFNAGFLHQFIRGAPLETCLAWGNMAGAFSITRAGGTEAFRDRKHLERFFRERGFSPEQPTALS